MKYTGRFAPSPSGPLHFGSLVAALGSYFQAKANNGTWLVRMEDLDPPREMAGAANLILKALEAYQLHWDGEVLFQSHRHDAYQEQIDTWLTSEMAYYCRCTRKQIKAAGGYYQGTCRDKKISSPDGCAVRVKVDEPVLTFNDIRHGTMDIAPGLAGEDFIIKRRDGLFAYNLAVVLDDIYQGVTEVVRGADLIEPTGRQISLYKLLGLDAVSYLHLPLAIDSTGNKLSKQNHAKAIDLQHPKPTLLKAMHFLGFDLPQGIEEGRLDEIIGWGTDNWSVSQLPGKLEIPSPFSGAV
ncbi:tRNA glutamyl-Q(34) synthetase GluQRS [Vibrio sp. JC009]|uniref:tRNA glutamyl-Q(34) synthetase GluQRS n=1 Tax=Vibrio sp. JC009 TaxID=2912314 RepID=UPI0023B0C077|nr:tRNA glutamyl-Q(34) synthetase GluQRS [Vibrio sp. JC009]WED22372.1 tRNA glutamyl-Q(34) synthetase GluQRS [Vibrio sp. JC009]